MYNVAFTLIDENPDVVNGYAFFLGPYKNWKFRRGDIMQDTADTLVSPGNSVGDMQGGIDKLYLECFGYELEALLRVYIREGHGGILPVGKSQMIPLKSDNYAYLMCTPTMPEPQVIQDEQDIYRAARGLFAEIHRINQETKKRFVRSVNLPGLGTGCGALTGHQSGRMVAKAYANFLASVQSAPDNERDGGCCVCEGSA